MKYAEVLILRGVNQYYTYKIPADLTVGYGDPVIVPFGRSKVKGVVMSIINNEEQTEKNESYKIKEIIGVDESRKPFTSSQKIAFRELKKQCFSSAYLAYQTVVGSRKIRDVSMDIPDKEYKRTEPYKLTKKQSHILKELCVDNKPALLHGVTGSGKTEIYMQRAAQVLEDNKQALILVPEISLTPQFYEQFKARFGEKVEVLHSGLTPKQRDIAWTHVANDEIPLVVGPRSAIFSPFTRLGLVVIDEAHDGAYKQDRHPRYDTVRLAEAMCEELEIPLILGTATPLIEQVSKYKGDEYHYLPLNERVSAKSLPPVRVVDLNQERFSGPFSPEFISSIESRLEKKEKVLVMINRRGYAPYVICQACLKPLHCTSCLLGMTYHKDRTFRCHRCDVVRPMTHTCAHCKKDRLAFSGQGTQKIELELQRNFPKANIVRLDRDSAQSAKKMASLLKKFKEDGDILVGTQMIAKGHHIDAVTFVGVLGLDTTLNMPDFRAAENTFQLLTQVAGRAGRGEVSGEVCVQTRFPDHYAILAGKEHDYESFYQQEIQYREVLGYPPESRLIHVIARGERLRLVKQALNKWVVQLNACVEDFGMDVEVLGPKAAPFEQIRGQFRWHVLIKCFGGSYDEVKESIRILIENPKLTPSGTKEPVQIGIDCDPRAIL